MAAASTTDAERPLALRFLGDGSTTWLSVPLAPPRLRAVEDRASALPPGTAVLLHARGPAAVRRLRRFAGRTRTELETLYLPLPTVGSASYLVEDAPEALGYFTGTMLTVPPGVTSLTAAVDGVLRLARWGSSGWLLRQVAPDAVAVGRRM